MVSQAIAAGTWRQWASGVRRQSTRIRQLAARGITDPDQLRDLVRASAWQRQEACTVSSPPSGTIAGRGAPGGAATGRSGRRRRSHCAPRRATDRRRVCRDAGESRKRGRTCSRSTLARRPRPAVAGGTWRARVTPSRATASRSKRRPSDSAPPHSPPKRLGASANSRNKPQRPQRPSGPACSRPSARPTRAARAPGRSRRGGARMVSLLRQAQAALGQGGTARAAPLGEAIATKMPQAPALPEWFARDLEALDARLRNSRTGRRSGSCRSAPSWSSACSRWSAPRCRPRNWRDRSAGCGTNGDPAARRRRRPLTRVAAVRRSGGAATSRAASILRGRRQRKENQARREELLERLAAFAAEQAGEQPNWHTIRVALFGSREEWQQYAPVDQSVIKPLQRALPCAARRVAGAPRWRVRAQRAGEARHHRPRRGVGPWRTRARPSRRRRGLQHTLKIVGIVPRHVDHALSEEFRRHCDAVFQRSWQEFAAHGVAIEGDQAQAVAVVRGAGAHCRTDWRATAGGREAARRAARPVRLTGPAAARST